MTMVHANLSRAGFLPCVDEPPFRWARASAGSAGHVIGQALALPFDTARAMHAAAARSGLIRKSILENRDFEASLMSLERLMLGPWARRV
jgi:hypothetical protein